MHFSGTKILLIALVANTWGCSAFDVLPGKPKKTSTPGPAEIEEPPPKVIATREPAQLSPARKLRRLSLDIRGVLPEIDDLNIVRQDARKTNAYIGLYAGETAAARQLAATASKYLNLKPGNLPSMEFFISDGDITLGSQLTDSTRIALITEPENLIRYTIDRGLAFSTLFTASYSITTPSLNTLWEQTQGNTVWPGESLFFSEFASARPAAGLLASLSLLTGIAPYHSTDTTSRNAGIMQTLLCREYEKNNAHAFWNLEEADFETNLREVSLTKVECRGCHIHFESLKPAFSAVGVGNDFDNWKQVTASDTTSGFYGGTPYSSLDQFGEFFGSDSRSQKCFVDGFVHKLMQRPLHGGDAETWFKAKTAMDQNHETIKPALLQAIYSKEYSWGPVDQKTKGKTLLKNSSGLKFLRTSQWKSIISQLAPNKPIDVSMDLDPGRHQSVDGADHMPAGPYWHATERVARQLASAIVTTELADGYAARARKVFPLLPDGPGTGATGDEVTEQLRYLWQFLIGEYLENDSEQLANLISFWNEAAEIGTEADDVRAAWRTVLTGLLSDPEFVSY